MSKPRRPMRTEEKHVTRRQRRAEGAYSRARLSDEPGHKHRRPSEEFDWDRALTLNAITLRDLGYQLTPQQQKRIDNA